MKKLLLLILLSATFFNCDSDFFKSPEAIAAEAEREQDRIAKENRQIYFENLIKEKKIDIGMTKFQVTRSWGNPTLKNDRTSSTGSFDQWVYKWNDTRTTYVYFRDGLMSSWSENNYTK